MGADLHEVFPIPPVLKQKICFVVHRIIAIVYAPIRSMPWVITSPVFSHLTKSSLIYFRVAKSHRRLRSGLLNYQCSINHDDFDYKFGGVCGYLIQKYKGLLFLFPEHNVVTVVRTITRSFYRPLDCYTQSFASTHGQQDAPSVRTYLLDFRHH